MPGILLDTHVLDWMLSGRVALSPAAETAIRTNTGALFCSSISGIELALHERQGRVSFTVPVRDLMSLLRRSGIEEIPVDWGIAADAPGVPLPHRDPFDRIIVATAFRRGLDVVTRDGQMHGCPGLTVIW